MLFLLALFVLVSSSSQLCDDINKLDISDGQHLANGDIIYKGVTYNPSDYFIDDGVLKTCVCKKEICPLKCCPIGYGYNIKGTTCTEVAVPFSPMVVDQYLQVQSHNASEYFHFNFGKPNCTKNEARVLLGQVYSDRNELRTDGNLYIEVPSSIPPWMLRGPDKYCVDTFIFDDGNGNVKHTFDALVCFDPDKEKDNYAISSTCMLISCVFILATLAVYGWLPELRNLHGRVLMAYLVCLFVGFVCLATMQILLKIDNIKINCCVTLTIIIYFSLLAAFFWLNVMCFDIWWTFSGKRGITIEKMTTRAKFYAYSIYAFGFPTMLTIIMVSLEFSGLQPHPLLPLLRYQGCFLAQYSKLLYLYGPIVILCLANIAFFVLTAIKIAQIRKEISVLKSRDSAKHDGQNKERQRLCLYMKLFVVMGISWLLEVISALNPEADNVFRFIDAYNVLIGVFIFIIFVCKRKIFRLIKKRYKQMRGDSLTKSQMSTRTTSSRDDIALTTRNQ